MGSVVTGVILTSNAPRASLITPASFWLPLIETQNTATSAITVVIAIRTRPPQTGPVISTSRDLPHVHLDAADDPSGDVVQPRANKRGDESERAVHERQDDDGAGAHHQPEPGAAGRVRG